jgi:hypothetical protein
LSKTNRIIAVTTPPSNKIGLLAHGARNQRGARMRIGSDRCANDCRRRCRFIFGA